MLKNRPILAIRMLLVQPIISAINWGFCEIARHIHEVIKTTNGKQFERDREADFSLFSAASFIVSGLKNFWRLCRRGDILGSEVLIEESKFNFSFVLYSFGFMTS
jgi:hypothetical protein